MGARAGRVPSPHGKSTSGVHGREQSRGFHNHVRQIHAQHRAIIYLTKQAASAILKDDGRRTQNPSGSHPILLRSGQLPQLPRRAPLARRRYLPACGSQNVLFLEKYNRWHCREKHDAPQFTLKTGTIMEDSPIGLDKWLMAMWQIVNCKNGISSYEVHRAIGITQKSAWFLDHRIRLALTMGYHQQILRPDRS